MGTRERGAESHETDTDGNRICRQADPGHRDIEVVGAADRPVGSSPLGYTAHTGRLINFNSISAKALFISKFCHGYLNKYISIAKPFRRPSMFCCVYCADRGTVMRGGMRHKSILSPDTVYEILAL